MATFLSKHLNPWKAKRARQEQRLAELRQRGGDDCARCRRPLRFDLPPGHDQGARIEEVATGDFRLCHARCNPAGKDDTGAVLARARVKNEAALFERSRRQRAA